jgi:hypothetical protein
MLVVDGSGINPNNILYLFIYISLACMVAINSLLIFYVYGYLFLQQNKQDFLKTFLQMDRKERFEKCKQRLEYQFNSFFDILWSKV